MLEATCTNCGRDVRITPDAEFCAACGENLKALIPTDQMSQYFYDRASSLAETASNRAALQEVQRGLDHVDSAELHLLAAILAENEGEYDLMRRYVSRIPVSDRLRDEGEWLLRSHQARKSAKRLSALQLDSGRQDSVIRSAAEPAEQPIRDQSIRDQSIPDQPIRMQRIGQSMSDTQLVGPTREIVPMRKPVNVLDPAQGSRRSWPGLLTILLLLGVLWIGWRFLNGGFGDQQSAAGDETAPIGAGADQVENVQPAEQPSSVEPQVTVTQPQPPAQQNAPSNNITNVVVDSATEEPQTLVGTGGLATEAGVSQPYDLNKFLLDNGRADLAAFRLDAAVKDNVLLISGTVDSTTQRDEVMALAKNVSVLFTVSATDLLVRQPDRYTIAEGDTLWVIAEKLYGNGDRWQEIFDANQDVLSSPDAIIIGQTLTIPRDN